MNVAVRELLQGHFRPPSEDGGVNPLPKEPAKINSLSHLDKMLLDILLDDVECVELVTDMLNSESTFSVAGKRTYAKEEVQESFLKLLDLKYVCVYLETDEENVKLQLAPPALAHQENAWFGLTPTARLLAQKLERAEGDA